MFATFDDRGRLFVAESSGQDLYAELRAGTRNCRVRLLEDQDGDGRFDTARVYADRLVFPMGPAWRDTDLRIDRTYPGRAHPSSTEGRNR